jgi:DNA-binding LacI/PurR family transcriptional regulator
LIRSQNVTVVVLDREIPGVDNLDIVRGDSFGGAYDLASYLVDLGHEHIAILSGPEHISTSVDRVSGFREAMREAGLDHNLENVYWGSFSQSSGFDIAKEAMANTPRPTALLAVNNFIANGALQAINSSGMNVPYDISLVSFDDIPETINPTPFLTVAVQAAYDMGYKATKLLLARLADEGPEECQEIILPTRIIIRNSTAPPPVLEQL